ncbi:hypothetical protein YC2023_077869 [Brassica napus]
MLVLLTGRRPFLVGSNGRWDDPIHLLEYVKDLREKGEPVEFGGVRILASIRSEKHIFKNLLETIITNPGTAHTYRPTIQADPEKGNQIQKQVMSMLKKTSDINVPSTNPRFEKTKKTLNRDTSEAPTKEPRAGNATEAADAGPGAGAPASSIAMTAVMEAAAKSTPQAIFFISIVET